ASKKPRVIQALIPIEDQHVAKSLHFDSTNYWTLLREALVPPEVREAAQDVGVSASASHLSVLRIIDIVVWMRQHGFESLDDPIATVGYDRPLA
ncbi:MAG: DUF6308 family protein, partial [Acidimicrobiia bacterium]